MTDTPTRPRHIFEVSGDDRFDFLQGLVTNDVQKCKSSLVYAALLTAQGKYIADFFLLERGDAILLDVDTSLAQDLGRRLMMYKLRANVTIASSTLSVSRGVDDMPTDAVADPRHPALGWRLYSDETLVDDVDWDALRVAHTIPESGAELTPDTYILEAGFERLNGVDFRKGCYVGQEIVARMKHKTTLRKGLVQVAISGQAPIGSEILAEGKTAGTLFTQSGDKAIAYLRFDRAKGVLHAGDAELKMGE
ncbi:CAF17-like 4Fe-4S cluster assembly/insertion protein YgfZ [Cochlodiniinecator piscidefendens]|uniref:CAF17-like 4Fe-4S cluster assembly/insertion protein YgfZ n=1 Tax=Cochlodiniinecator piscidefendens TaxID=2715756 RepID=UPI001408894C|nr:folate-binding protein YgfZ [Cochlodiniinecator piscidefendens]